MTLVRTAAHARALALAQGADVFADIKAANLKQLTAILAHVCSKGGMPTLNRHLLLDELAGLGWIDLQPLCDDQGKGIETLAASIATLVKNLEPFPVCKARPMVHLKESVWPPMIQIAFAVSKPHDAAAID